MTCCRADRLTGLLYSGEFTNATTGQQYLRARFYSPSTGTFNRLDPFSGNMQDPQSLHKYLYTHGNPVMGVDPSGLFSTVQTITAVSTGATISLSVVGGGILAKRAGASFARGATAGSLLGVTIVNAVYGNRAQAMKAYGTAMLSSAITVAINLGYDVWQDDPYDFWKREPEYSFAAFEAFSWTAFNSLVGEEKGSGVIYGQKTTTKTPDPFSYHGVRRSESLGLPCLLPPTVVILKSQLKEQL